MNLPSAMVILFTMNTTLSSASNFESFKDFFQNEHEEDVLSISSNKKIHASINKSDFDETRFIDFSQHYKQEDTLNMVGNSPRQVRMLLKSYWKMKAQDNLRATSLDNSLDRLEKIKMKKLIKEKKGVLYKLRIF